MSLHSPLPVGTYCACTIFQRKQIHFTAPYLSFSIQLSVLLRHSKAPCCLQSLLMKGLTPPALQCMVIGTLVGHSSHSVVEHGRKGGGLAYAPLMVQNWVCRISPDSTRLDHCPSIELLTSSFLPALGAPTYSYLGRVKFLPTMSKFMGKHLVPI